MAGSICTNTILQRPSHPPPSTTPRHHTGVYVLSASTPHLHPWCLPPIPASGVYLDCNLPLTTSLMPPSHCRTLSRVLCESRISSPAAAPRIVTYLASHGFWSQKQDSVMPVVGCGCGALRWLQTRRAPATALHIVVYSPSRGRKSLAIPLLSLQPSSPHVVHFASRKQDSKPGDVPTPHHHHYSQYRSLPCRALLLCYA